MSKIIKTKAPGRVCFFGDHQDYLSLPVIAGTIDRFINIEGKPNGNEHLKIKLIDFDSQINIDLNAPDIFSLHQNYPNPFNPSITLNLQIDKQRKVSAFIFNINGKRVKTLAEDQIFNLGGHTMKWHSEDDFGRKVSNGIYFIQITSEDIIIKRKIIYMK